MNINVSAAAIIGFVFFATPVNSASVYKCTKQDHSVIFTDKPCPAETQMQVIYTETEKDMQKRVLEEKISALKKLINNDELEAAKEYARKNDLSEPYHDLLAQYLKNQAEQEQQKIEEQKQQQLSIQQQAIDLQKQQVELQKQQLAVDKAQLQQQQLIGNQTYYPYSVFNVVPRVPRQNCYQPPGAKTCVPAGLMPQPYLNAPISSGGMNPPVSSNSISPSPSGSLMNPPVASGSVISTPPTILMNAPFPAGNVTPTPSLPPAGAHLPEKK